MDKGKVFFLGRLMKNKTFRLRWINRMCDYLNYEVETLKRVRIMNIKLDMPIGEYRELSKEEFIDLNKLLEDSTKTYEDNKKRKA